MKLPSLLLITLALTACSTTDEVLVDGQPRKLRRGVSSQFEWAVQHYESGDYKDAVATFERLQKDGAGVPDFDLITFYLGMSRFKLGQLPEAARDLESFTRSGTQRQEAQEARLALLLTFEKLGRWKDIAGLSAETDKLTLFQYNRAVLKLLWARALVEQGEFLGARTVLEDGSHYLDKVGPDDRAMPYYANPDQDLWGRYHFTETLLQSHECDLLVPKEIKAGTKARKRLYPAWLEARTDCLRKTLRLASMELFAKESSWSEQGERSLSESISHFTTAIGGYLKEEAPRIDSHRALKEGARGHLYRLLGTLDEELKVFKDRAVRSDNLERLRKQLDRLLVGISGPS